MGKLFTWLGSIGTLAYSGLLAYLIHRRWNELVALELNALGDFLAGAFGPLAILWLVLGYFQQGIELRLNSKALHLQAEELANSVEQQRELVKVARDQYHSDREAMEHQMKALADERERIRAAALPKFSLSFGGSHSAQSTHSIFFANYGQTCTGLRLVAERSDVHFQPDEILLVKTGETVKFEFTIPTVPPFEETRVSLSFTDGRGEVGSYQYRMSFTRGDSYSTARLDPIDSGHMSAT